MINFHDPKLYDKITKLDLGNSRIIATLRDIDIFSCIVFCIFAFKLCKKKRRNNYLFTDCFTVTAK